ncbi:ATP-binding cassette domain-containing protein [Actinomadura madurae]|nr:ATP-binding cassette domain-containing protein [Actinomadura madurae]
MVGPSGAGKTTITHLVPRLYDPTSGTVRIGGHDVRDLTFASLCEHVGVVTQDAHLFNDTLRANLLYARPDAGERDLVEACKAALIWDTIESLPDGLDTMAGDRGYRFSGGEKQRIALARLLVKAPPIVVLDEATAHLDSESEARIQRALTTALAGRTSLVIAHRLSTVREADQILVIDSGTVRQCGTHDSLLAEGGLYADLYHRQFAARPRSRRTPESDERAQPMTDYLPQVATVPFRLGRPEDLPGDLAEVAVAGAGTRHAVRLLDDAAWTGCDTLEGAARAARAALAADHGPRVRDDPRESAANRDNDLAFGIERHGGAALPLMVDAGLAALIGLLEAARRGTGLPGDDWADLFAGFATVTCWPPTPPTLPSVRRRTRRARRVRHCRRTRSASGSAATTSSWSSPSAARSRCAACARPPTPATRPGARSAARTATTMMRASRGALRFAGDSGNDEYAAEIRPTLMPPIAPPKMSGLRWRDHEALISALAGAGDAWAALGDDGLIAGFRDALDGAYAAHRGVCEHFVGDSSPSLLATAGSRRSAVGVLSQFRDKRLGLLPPSGGREG